MKKTLKRVAVRAAIVVGETLIVLILIEVLVRLFMPQQLVQLRPDMYVPDNRLGWDHAPNIDTWINTGERAVRVMTDEYGNRVRPGENDSTAYRVLALGDSFVDAHQVAYEQTMTALLERRLNQKFT